MNLRELTQATGIAERQVRYLITEGILPPPRGARATAEYGEDHVEGVRRYLALKRLGFPPAAIKLLLEAKQGVPAPVFPGVTLVVEPDLIGSGRPIEPIVERVRERLGELLQPSEEKEEISDARSSDRLRRSTRGLSQED